MLDLEYSKFASNLHSTDDFPGDRLSLAQSNDATLKIAALYILGVRIQIENQLFFYLKLYWGIVLLFWLELFVKSSVKRPDIPCDFRRVNSVCKWKINGFCEWRVMEIVYIKNSEVILHNGSYTRKRYLLKITLNLERSHKT